MSDREIRSCYLLLKGNFSFNVVALPTPRCLYFRAVPIRFGQGWVRVRQETYPCHTPKDLLRAMREAGLIRAKAETFLNGQVEAYLKRQ